MELWGADAGTAFYHGNMDTSPHGKSMTMLLSENSRMRLE